VGVGWWWGSGATTSSPVTSPTTAGCGDCSVAVDVVGMEPRLYHLGGDREGQEEAASQPWSSCSW